MINFLNPLFDKEMQNEMVHHCKISNTVFKSGLVEISKATALLVNSELFYHMCRWFSYKNQITIRGKKGHPVVEYFKHLVRQMEHNLTASHNCAFESLLSNGEVDFESHSWHLL